MWNSLKYVFAEHKNNLYRIWQMSLSHMKKQTVRTSLGMGWVFIRDLVFFVIFIIFRYLMSGSAEVDGMNFIVYLVTGLVPWFFMNEVINSGVNAISMNKAIIKSIQFPITIIPTIEVIAIFLKRLFTLIIAFVVCAVFGYLKNFNILLLIYYFISMLLLMVSFNLVLSAFIAISLDFTQLYLSITRVIFFSLPILWSFEKLNNLNWAITLIKLNPMVYIIIGFRDAFVIGNAPNLEYSIYFWIVCVTMLFLGSFTQFRLRKYYSDFI